MDTADFYLDAYDYDLPEEQIARYPASQREACRLLVGPGLAGSPYSIQTSLFARIADFLPPGALLVLNNTKVLPARLYGQRPGGGKAEFLLLTPLPLLKVIEESQGWRRARAEALLKPAGKFAAGKWFEGCGRLKAQILERGDFGKAMVDLWWRGDLEAIFNEIGKIPLPPYIKRPAEESDKSAYQTVFAKKTGAVAAPTAGLHFTGNILADLLSRGFQLAELTLHVGYGTFTPLRCKDIRRHEMHAEYLEISEKTAGLIRQAKEDGRLVIAVGTTSLRAMEGMYDSLGEIGPFSGSTNIFIYPGKSIHVADGLITNFHLPRSSLLMLVAAMTGRERILRAYSEAVSMGFRFFSYGDAMLII